MIRQVMQRSTRRPNALVRRCDSHPGAQRRGGGTGLDRTADCDEDAIGATADGDGRLAINELGFLLGLLLARDSSKWAIGCGSARRGRGGC